MSHFYFKFMQVKPTIYGKRSEFSTLSTLRLEKIVENFRKTMKNGNIHLYRLLSFNGLFTFE